MIKPSEQVFVDSGAWIALAVVRDPCHERARATWDGLRHQGARIRTSLPVVVETFTYLDRRGSRELAQRWRLSLAEVKHFKILGCTASDLTDAWPELDRKNLHKLSLVDATSFFLMRRHSIRAVFGFDTHFAVAGFQLLG